MAGCQQEPCSGFLVTAVCCHLKLTKRMERKLDKGMRPYDLEFVGYRKFQKALEDLGAFDVDREYYGGLNFKAETREIGEAIARAAREILSQNEQSPSAPG
jgi:hypothetical protein